MKLSTIDLRLFAAIADLGGITAAARKLGLTKSLVSRELAALEERLGTRLVQRTTRRVSLTDSGELLAIYARRVVEEVENAEAAIEAMRETPRGVLTVSVPFSILRFILIPRLGDFRRTYPDIRLNLDATMRVTNLIDEGIDVAIRIGELASSSLVARRLTATSIILVAAPDYLAAHGVPPEPAALADHQLLSLGRSVEPENWVLNRQGAAPVSIDVAPIIAVHDPGLLLDLATQGLGIAPVPLIYARSAIAEGRVTHVLPECTRGMAPIHAVYPSRRLLAPKVRAFIEFAAGAFGEVTP